MKKVIPLLMNGEHLPQIFITIVRYVLPSEDHLVQKLLLLYMEIIEKTDSEGVIASRMILICQNLRNNLQHLNEVYSRVDIEIFVSIERSRVDRTVSAVYCAELRAQTSVREKERGDGYS